MDGLLSLVNAVEYKGFKIKEWNIVQFAKLSPVLSAIAKDYESLSINYTEFSDVLSKAADGSKMGLTKSALSFLAPLVERAPEVLKISLGITQEKVEELSFSEGTVLLLLIYKTNLEHISGFFAGLTTAEETTV